MIENGLLHNIKQDFPLTPDIINLIQKDIEKILEEQRGKADYNNNFFK
jgi:hypothetical protein